LSIVSLSALLPCAAAPLFNGKNLNGFYTWLVDSKYEDPRGVFSVTNEMLRISGNGLGYLATKQEYTNYQLIAEFKWGSENWRWGNRIGRARDSGIFLHSVGADGSSVDGNGAFRAAIECQIFQGATGDLLLIRGTNVSPSVTAEIDGQRDADGWPFWQRDGARTNIVRWGRLNWFGKSRVWEDKLDFRGPNDVEKPYGEWNRIEVLSENGHLQIRLNGVLVNEAFDVHPRSGKILLQCEGSEIFFRKLEIYPP
jgi:3-keto-disaccharide hydrolase